MTKRENMEASEVPTIREILSDYLDTDDPYYAAMIDALATRESMVAEAYAAWSVAREQKKVLRVLNQNPNQ